MHPALDIELFEGREVGMCQAKRELSLENHRVILTVTRLVRRKGVDQVIRALPKVLQAIPDAFYLVVGEGTMRLEWESLAKAVGVSHRVAFTGRVSDEQLPLYYSACDVFVLVSRLERNISSVEGFGIVYLEAGAFGKPVIAGNQGGVADAVEPGVTGIVVDSEVPESIANALCKVLENPELAREMGERGKERAWVPTDWRIVSDRMVNNSAL